MALLNFHLLRLWLGSNQITSPLTALAISLCPYWLNQSLEFTGVSLGLLCLMGALLAWRNGSRWLFFAIMLVGVTNRQSLVFLLVFPGLEVLHRWLSVRKVEWGVAAGVLIVLGTVVLLEFTYPQTYARMAVARSLKESLSPLILLKNLALGIALLAGIRAVWGWLRGESPKDNFRANIARPALPLSVMILGAVPLLRGEHGVFVVTPLFESVQPLFTVLLVCSGAWLADWRRLPAFEVLACSVLYVVLVSLRGQWWDYYLIEPALVLATSAVGAVKGEKKAGFRPWLVGIMFVGGILYAVWFANFLGKHERRMVSYERALRAGDLQVKELSDASFGYLGWKLFDSAKKQDKPTSQLADFLKYVEARRSVWFDGVLYIFTTGAGRSIHPDGELQVLPELWQDRPFPLSDDEWNRFIKRDEVSQ